MASGNLQKGASYKPLAENLDPQTATLRQIVEAHANTLSADGKKSFISSFTGAKAQFAPIFKDYLDRPAVDFVETFADEESNPLVKVYEKNEKTNARRDMYSRVGAIEFHIQDQLQRTGALAELFPEGMPMATDRVIRPDKPQAKARRYTFNPGLMGEWLKKLDEYGQKNPQDIGIVKALEAQAHMGLRPGEIMNAPASALREPEKRSQAWGFFLDTDTPGVKMDENLNVAVGPRTYEIMQQALNVSSANDRNLFVNPDGSPIGKGQMTRVAKLIKVPGIMTDEQTGAKLDSLQEAYDLRRMWVTLALNEFPGQGNRVGAAQGRAVGAVTGGGGALKEYYSPSPGFYGKEATSVPFTIDEWLFEARVDELPERMQPPEGQRVSFKTDFTGPSLLPIFEDKDAPIQMGSLEAKTFAPKPKTEVIRPATKPVQTSEADRPLVQDGNIDANANTASLEADLESRGLSLNALLDAGDTAVEKVEEVVKKAAEKIPPSVAKKLPLVGAPFGYQLAKETAEDMGLPGPLPEIVGAAGAAAEVVSPIAPTDVEDISKGYAGTIQQMEKDRESILGRARQSRADQLAAQDAGFIDIDRGPEAASANQDQGFLSR